MPFMRRVIRLLRRYLFWIVIIALLATAFFIGRASVYRAHPELAQSEQGNAILTEVGKLIELPTNEKPTIATVKDAVGARQGQPFLATALNGDVLIVYPNAQRAILYRPSTNMLIAVGPVSAQVPSVPKIELKTASSTYEATTTTTKSKR